jgi:hypothetical protein
MRLSFDRAGVMRLLAHAKAAPAHQPTYGEKGPVGPALWIVGDQGVYLMSNGKPGLLATGARYKPNQQFVVYAKEIDPTVLPFDTWWERKRQSFGGDDGADSIAVAEIESALATYTAERALMLDLTPKAISLVSYVRRAKA